MLTFVVAVALLLQPLALFTRRIQKFFWKIYIIFCEDFLYFTQCNWNFRTLHFTRTSKCCCCCCTLDHRLLCKRFSCNAAPAPAAAAPTFATTAAYVAETTLCLLFCLIYLKFHRHLNGFIYYVCLLCCFRWCCWHYFYFYFLTFAEKLLQ